MKTTKCYTLIVMLLFAVSMAAQNNGFEDDIYYSSKTKKTEKAEPVKKAELAPAQERTLEVAWDNLSSNRDVDEYNRRYVSSDRYIDEEVTDTVVEYADGELMQRIVKFHDPSKITIIGADNINIVFDGNNYELNFDEPANNGMAVNFHSGYYPWYTGYYSPWAWRHSGYYGGYNPWYYGWYGPSYYYGWYDPWHYSYGWYDPWYYGGGYGGWYGGYYGGYYGGGYYGSHNHHYSGNHYDRNPAYNNQGGTRERNAYSSGTRGRDNTYSGSPEQRQSSRSRDYQGSVRSSSDADRSTGTSVRDAAGSSTRQYTPDGSSTRTRVGGDYSGSRTSGSNNSSSGSSSSSSRSNNSGSSTRSSGGDSYSSGSGSTRSSSSGSYSSGSSGGSRSSSSSGSYSSGSSGGSYSSGGGSRSSGSGSSGGGRR